MSTASASDECKDNRVCSKRVTILRSFADADESTRIRFIHFAYHAILPELIDAVCLNRTHVRLVKHYRGVHIAHFRSFTQLNALVTTGAEGESSNPEHVVSFKTVDRMRNDGTLKTCSADMQDALNGFNPRTHMVWLLSCPFTDSRLTERLLLRPYPTSPSSSHYHSSFASARATSIPVKSKSERRRARRAAAKQKQADCDERSMILPNDGSAQDIIDDLLQNEPGEL